jgi:hypothetical protein
VRTGGRRRRGGLGATYLPSAHAQTTVFDFTGNCTDCSGVGTGVLTLQNYTAGAAIDPNNFVSFTYASNLATISITDNELDYTLAATATTGAQSFVSSMGPGSSYLITPLGSSVGSSDTPSRTLTSATSFLMG